MKKKILIIILALVAVCAVSVVFCYSFLGSSSAEFFAMDTYNSFNVTGADHKKVSDEIKAEVNNLDKNILSRQSKDSKISALNLNRGGELSDRLFDYFRILLDVYTTSGGKFDFTLGAVSDLWGFGKKTNVPDKKELDSVLSLSGAGKILLDGHTVSFPEGVVIDFGPVGKGIALDVIRDDILKESHISKGVVSLGGSVLTYGSKDFRVAVSAPFGGGVMGVLTLPECCVSTSGTYERFFEEDGKRYHHILDPYTGYPVENGLVSVTVVSQSGILSDALSTACLACGLKDGMALAERYGCDAVFIDSDRNVYVTDGLSDKIEITDSSYILSNE